MPELNVAIIGCGGMGGVHLARWSEVSGANIVAVCDSDGACAMRVATEFATQAHTDWREVVTSSGANVIDICVPTRKHAVIASAALQRGIHVMCETPLTRTLDEARGLTQTAEISDRMLMPAFCHRFHPSAMFARELIDNDDLGRIVMFRMRLSDQLTALEDRWVSDPNIAGPGVLADVTIHSIDLFRWLVGEIKQVSGFTTTVNPHLTGPDSAVLTLRAENGAIGVIESSWSTPGGQNMLELYGTAGACIVDYDTRRVRYRTADMAVWETKEIGGPDRFQRMISHFADTIRGLQAPLVTANDGLRAIEIIAAI